MRVNIKELIGETNVYDKKQALEERRPKSWCKSVSAFANTFGGAIIFGVSDLLVCSLITQSAFL